MITFVYTFIFIDLAICSPKTANCHAAGVKGTTKGRLAWISVRLQPATVGIDPVPIPGLYRGFDPGDFAFREAEFSHRDGEPPLISVRPPAVAPAREQRAEP